MIRCIRRSAACTKVGWASAIPGSTLAKWWKCLDQSSAGRLPQQIHLSGAGMYVTAFPQARVVAISECASHAIVTTDVASCWAGGQTLAFSLYRQLTEEMLLTTDRSLYGFPA